MKRNALPELTSGWWRKNQPEGLASARELESALTGYDKAYVALKSGGTEALLQSCLKAIESVAQAAGRVQAEAEKSLKNPKPKLDVEDYKNTIAALEKLVRVLDQARDQADDLIAQDEGVFGSPILYRTYLKKMLRKTNTGALSFAFGAGSNPADHRMLLHRSSSGEVLASKLRRDAGLKKLTYGVAGAHADKPGTLVLELEGPQMAGLARKCRGILKIFRPQPFDHVIVTIGGKEIPETEDAEDAEIDETDELAPALGTTVSDVLDAAHMTGTLKALMPAISSALEAGPDRKPEILRLVGVCKARLAAGDLAEAGQAIEQLRALLAQLETASHGSAERQPQTAQALQTWQIARTAVLDQIHRLGAAIAATRDPEARQALIYLQAIGKNLTANPSTRQSVIELERYLETDEMIEEVETENPFGIAVTIRAPLSEALAALSNALTA